ncbi:MAG: methyltransferase [Gaiella sp.]
MQPREACADLPERPLVLAVAALAPSPPHAGGVAAVRLRRLFADAGYEAPGVARCLHGTSSPRGLVDRRELHVHRRRLLEREDPLALLISLFLLGDDVMPDAAERSLLDVGALLESGLVEEHGGVFRPLVRIVPHDDLLLASDRDAVDLLPDHVPGVHRPSATQAHLTPRRSARLALDVGTGLGIQALLLARHTERVVATDVNERALAFSAFNAALNNVGNIELRHGSFFEPVAGERFEIAVANPPYVISPGNELTYRDGPFPRDGVSEHVVRSLPSLLTEGGVATAMISWVVAEPDRPTAAPRAWLAGSDCDGLLFCTAAEDALSTAASWNRECRHDPELYAARVDAWADFFAGEGIDQIAYGALVMRRHGRGPRWWSEHALPADSLAPASDQLERLIHAEDHLAALDDDALLDARLLVTPTATVEITHRLETGTWQTETGAIQSSNGIPLRAHLDETALDLVRLLDGRQTLRACLPAVLGGVPTAEAAIQCSHLARGLLRLGLVAVVDDAGSPARSG